MVYSQALLDVNGLAQQRRDFARLLGELINDGVPIVYIDETTFNTWLRKTHSWQRPLQKVHIKLNPKRIGECTLYGAIGACMELPVYYVGKSTNKEDFIEFLKLVKIELGALRPMLVYDNHPCQTSKLASIQIEENFQPLKLPKFSCEFNSIEKVRSQLKATF